MADHIRKQIRDAVTTALTGLATTGTRVFASRVYPLPPAKLPALRVYTLGEEIEVASMSGTARRLNRSIQVVVEGVARATVGLDDTLDQIAAEVEPVLNNNELGGLVEDLVLARTEINLSGEGDKPIGLVRLEFVAEAETLENDPTTAV